MACTCAALAVEAALVDVEAGGNDACCGCWCGSCDWALVIAAGATVVAGAAGVAAESKGLKEEDDDDEDGAVEAVLGATCGWLEPCGAAW